MEVLVPRAAGGWACLGLGMGSRALGRGLTVYLLFLHRTALPGKIPAKHRAGPPPRPSSGTLGSTLCFSGPFSTTAKMGSSGSFPFFSVPVGQTVAPVPEAFWARICGNDENVDEFLDPWVSSGVPPLSSLSRQGWGGWKGRQLLTSTDQCARWPPRSPGLHRWSW